MPESTPRYLYTEILYHDDRENPRTVVERRIVSGTAPDGWVAFHGVAQLVNTRGFMHRFSFPLPDAVTLDDAFAQLDREGRLAAEVEKRLLTEPRIVEARNMLGGLHG